MKNLPLILLISILGITLNAQTNLDSLYTVWQDKTQQDTTRLKALNKFIILGYLYSKPDSTFYYAQLQYDFAKSKDIKKHMAKARNSQGISFHMKSDFSKALEYFERSLKNYEDMNDKDGINRSLTNIGLIYQSQGDYLKALSNFTRSSKAFEELGDKESLSNLMNYIGTIYDYQSDFPMALLYYQKSLKIKEEIGDIKGINYTLNNIGGLYFQQGDFTKALEYYQRCLTQLKEIDERYGIAMILNNIGSCYQEQEDYQKALEYFQRSLKLNEELGNKQSMSLALRNTGTIYKNQNDFSKALEYYQRCLKIQEEIGDQSETGRTLHILGVLYHSDGQYEKSIRFCQQSLKIAQKLGSALHEKDACQCLYEAYKAIGKGNEAIKYMDLLRMAEDSLHAEETVKKLQQMEFQNQVQADSLIQVEKELKVEMAHQAEVRKKNKNKNVAIGVGAFFLLLSSGFYGRWRYVKKSKAIIEKEKDRSDNLLLNILPSEIAEELKTYGKADARDFDNVSILFTDFKGFTQVSEKLTAKELIEEINICFKAFDHICEAHGVEKIKTIGDAYMAAGGLPIPSEDSIKNTVLAALEMQAFIANRIIEKDKLNEMSFKMRLGIHTGPVVAGIVGVKKFQYDIWGDTVNTAARMESSGEIGKVNISEDTYAALKDDPEFTFESRGKIQAKGKGEIEMYFVSKA